MRDVSVHTLARLGAEPGKSAKPAKPAKPELWRARELHGRAGGTGHDGIGTGFKALDEVLFDHGWPRAGLTELLSDAPGIGELRLVLPALATLSATEDRLIAWVAPPFVPYAPALRAAGIDLAKVLLVHPKDQDEVLWALEQSLRTGACCAVLGWPSEQSLKFTGLRRLQFAARQGGAWASLFRSVGAAGAASAAELRLRLWPRRRGLGVDVVKRRGGWPLPGIELAFDEYSGARFEGR